MRAPMRIGVDCQTLGGGARTGFATYLGNLLRGFQAGYGEHEVIRWTCQRGPGWRLPHQLWWDQVRVPGLAARDGVDLIHAPAFSGAVLRPCPLVMTVHDLMYTRHPEWLPSARARWYWGRWIPFTARRATAVIAPSEATRRDLISLAGVRAARVHVVPEAVDPVFLQRPSETEIRAYRATHGLTGPYVLYVGSIDRRKDLGGLVRAYARVRAGRTGLRLVLAGHLIPGRSALHADVQAAGATGDVVMPGLVPDEELMLLYAGAAAFVYPSWWEGFGLPTLEAMAMGVPVVTYRCASLPEVVGDAALLVDPPFRDTDLAAAIERVLSDSALRADLVRRGRERVAQFSWERAANLTMAVYRGCVERER